jgi:hypothetical protein
VFTLFNIEVAASRVVGVDPDTDIMKLFFTHRALAPLGFNLGKRMKLGWYFFFTKKRILGMWGNREAVNPRPMLKY